MLDCARRQSSCKYPQDAISNNYPVYAELQATIKALKTIQAQLLGHQDTKLDKPLTLPEKLNIKCNACTTKLTPYHNISELHRGTQSPMWVTHT